MEQTTSGQDDVIVGVCDAAAFDRLRKRVMDGLPRAYASVRGDVPAVASPPGDVMISVSPEMQNQCLTRAMRFTAEMVHKAREAGEFMTALERAICVETSYRTFCTIVWAWDNNADIIPIERDDGLYIVVSHPSCRPSITGPFVDVAAAYDAVANVVHSILDTTQNDG